MREIFVAPEAIEDLEEITDYIALDNPDAAEQVIADVWSAFVQLAEMPELGRVRDELAPGKALRFWPLHSYLIVYRFADTRLDIVRILSARRDLPDLLG